MDNKKITTILIDFDGVLTDGRKSIDHTGRTMFKHVNSRDNRAIRELIALGYRVIIVTSDSWYGNTAYADKLGCELIITREKGELNFEKYIAIGDDAWDLQLLTKADVAFCPADADVSVKRLFNIKILETNGGGGVIAEMIRHI